MIGRNKLTLNTATVKAALAMYLNSERYPSCRKLTVESVAVDHGYLSEDD